ncbi:hypothetical protein QR680_004793 [Steinernema hermaphroditum]|uniref:SCP domain-containing protein n=1 Tax=Steinernema hermaphroditum TaxID=289476 RepID=A0AA39HR11_9BILA|nr:hypothetical protein QR680_004793 [Steinernema hermaphroditum]
MRQIALDKHNEYRSQQALGKTSPKMGTVKNMYKLGYSCDLEKIAQRQVDTCNFVHSSRDILGQRGENIYRASLSNENLMMHVESAISNWWLEINEIRSPINAKGIYYGSRVGHYTQIVLAHNLNVGCAVKECSREVLFTCVYKKGNMLSKPTFEFGPPYADGSGKCKWSVQGGVPTLSTFLSSVRICRLEVMEFPALFPSAIVFSFVVTVCVLAVPAAFCTTRKRRKPQISKNVNCQNKRCRTLGECNTVAGESKLDTSLNPPLEPTISRPSAPPLATGPMASPSLQRTQGSDPPESYPTFNSQQQPSSNANQRSDSVQKHVKSEQKDDARQPSTKREEVKAQRRKENSSEKKPQTGNNSECTRSEQEVHFSDRTKANTMENISKNVSKSHEVKQQKESSGRVVAERAPSSHGRVSEKTSRTSLINPHLLRLSETRLVTVNETEKMDTEVDNDQLEVAMRAVLERDTSKWSNQKATPRVLSLNAKETQIAKWQQKQGTEYPTMNDVKSDWELNKEITRADKEVVVGDRLTTSIFNDMKNDWEAEEKTTGPSKGEGKVTPKENNLEEAKENLDLKKEAVLQIRREIEKNVRAELERKIREEIAKKLADEAVKKSKEKFDMRERQKKARIEATKDEETEKDRLRKIEESLMNLKPRVLNLVKDARDQKPSYEQVRRSQHYMTTNDSQPNSLMDATTKS